MASPIATIIKAHRLVGGMPMKNEMGDDIADSCVIDSHSFVHWDEGMKRVRLLREQSISGKQIDESFSPEAFATLQNCNILEG